MWRRVIAKPLGQLLIERKLLSPSQLEEALKIQKEKGGLLGQILVQQGYASEEAVAQALTAQYGFPYLPLRHYVIDPELLKLVPENVARQYCLVPVDRIGDTLTIAMADPLNTKAVEDIELLTRCSVHVFVSTLSEIQEAIGRCYGGSHHGNSTGQP
jgi:type IV pilus assembly protein PilB